MNVTFQNYLLNLISFYYYEFNHITFNCYVILPEFMLINFCFFLLIVSYALNLKILYRWSCLVLFIIYLYYLYIIWMHDFSFGAQDFLLETFIFTDYFFLCFRSMIIVTSLLILLLCQTIAHTTQQKILKEFIFLILFSIFFMLMLLSSNDFLFSYFSIEGMSFSLYILTATIYYNRFSLESALKYFILGGIASSILLYGISFIFIITSSLDFFYIKYYFLMNNTTLSFLDILFIISCLTLSFFFKLSAFPCHMWAPDVYEGIWTPITAFLAIVVKMVIFIFVIRVFCYIFNAVLLWQSFFLISGSGSILIGCLGALLQKKIKRFLAYTSINQIGFLLLGLSTNNLSGISSSLMFLMIYIIMNIIFFGILLNTQHFTQKFQIIYLTDLYAVNGQKFDLNFIWIITLFSMAGIPPLAGFFIKYYILLSLINLSLYFTTFLVLILSTISCYYYLNFIKYILFEKKKLKTLYYFNIECLSSVPWILLISTTYLITFIFTSSTIYSKILFLSFCSKYILQ